MMDSFKEGGKKFVFDIDGVIALKREDLDYSQAQPNEKMIRIINALHDMGNTIALFTARVISSLSISRPKIMFSFRVSWKIMSF